MSDHSRTLFSTWVALFLAIGSIACAYVVVIPATTFAQPSFMYVSQSQQSFQALISSTSTYMGLDTAPNATQLIGAANGLSFAGGLIGALLQAKQSDKLGRQKSVALSCAIAVLGGALQAGSVHIAMFIVARMIAGLGVGKRAREIRMQQSSDFYRGTVCFHTPLPE